MRGRLSFGVGAGLPALEIAQTPENRPRVRTYAIVV